MPRQAMNKTPIQSNEELKEQSNAVFQQTTSLTETVKLPTRGLIKGIPEEIAIKAIQRKDKKKVLMSNDDNILLGLLQQCIISPKDFNVYNLLPFEIEYCLYRLRTLTYGNTYEFKENCPYCGHSNEINIDLNDIAIIPVPDNFKTTFDIGPLPISGLVLTCKLLTEGERTAAMKKAEELRDATGAQNMDLDLIWETRIIAINGNSKLAPIEKTQIIDDLNDYDSEYFMEYYNRFDGNYGLQKELHYTCDNCRRKVDSEMPSIYTFFRPTFKFDIAK